MITTYKNQTPPPPKTPEEVSKIIRALLLDMGAATHMKGFFYLIRAIEIVYEDPDSIYNVVKGLYSRIAEEFETTPSCVERDIRTELRFILRAGKLFMLDEHFSHFGCRSKSVSSRKFIALFSEKLRNDMIQPGEAYRAI